MFVHGVALTRVFLQQTHGRKRKEDKASIHKRKKNRRKETHIHIKLSFLSVCLHACMHTCAHAPTMGGHRAGVDGQSTTLACATPRSVARSFSLARSQTNYLIIDDACFALVLSVSLISLLSLLWETGRQTHDPRNARIKQSQSVTRQKVIRVECAT